MRLNPIGVALLCASLGGCVYPGEVYESRGYGQVYGSTGSYDYDDRYYDDGAYYYRSRPPVYYGDTYYYSYNPGPSYYYRQGYGYYRPPGYYNGGGGRGRDHDHDGHDHDNDHHGGHDRPDPPRTGAIGGIIDRARDRQRDDSSYRGRSDQSRSERSDRTQDRPSYAPDRSSGRGNTSPLQRAPEVPRPQPQAAPQRPQEQQRPILRGRDGDDDVKRGGKSLFRN